MGRLDSIMVMPPASEADLSRLLDILSMTFNFPRESGDRYTELIGGAQQYRAIYFGGVLAGGLCILPMGQYFGGKSVPMAGIAVVGISPEYRSNGLAGELMRRVLKELHAHSWPLSTLYPATLPIYRRAGYEHAGVRCEISIPTSSIGIKSCELEIRRIVPGDDDAIVKSIYDARAVSTSGALDRNGFIWSRVREPRGETAQGFLVINPATGKAEGYAYYIQKAVQPAGYNLHLTDLAALTPAAGRRLLSFFADHRSLVREVTYHGNMDDPFLKLLPERSYTARLLEHWMLRIVDVSAALAARGYPRCINAELHLDVEDDVLLSNNGRYVLTLNNGAATVETGGRGDFRLDVRGLAAMYTGHVSPRDLLVMGLASPATHVENIDGMLSDMAAVFAGPRPWLSDMF